MTTQTAVFSGLPTGLTLTKKVFTLADPDTEVTGITGAVTERMNAKGQYVVAVTKAAVITGDHTIILFVGSTPIAIGKRTFAGTDGEEATTTPEVAVLNTATQTQITEIKAKTDNLPSDPADQSAIEAAITAATSPLATAANLALIPIDGTLTVTLANGVTHGGSTAMLRLGSSTTTPAFYVVNSSSDDNAHAVYFKAGSSMTGGAGLLIDGGSLQTTFIAPAVEGLYAGGDSVAHEGEIIAIKAKTDNLPSDPADQSAVEAAITAATSSLATAADLATVAGYLDTEIAAILADTNELQTDWVNGGRLDLILDARASQTSVDDLPTNAELATALGTADDAVLSAVSTLQTSINTIDDFIDTEVGAIKTKTDQMVFGETNSLNVNVIHYNGTLQSNGDLPQKLDSIQSSVNTIDDFVDTEITAIKAKTDLLVTFPTNFSSLDINASGHISRVVLVDTTTTNTDMVTSGAIATAVFTTTMTEAYPTDSAEFTLAQGLYLMYSTFAQFSINGTTVTCKKLDGTTTSAVFDLDSATTPTSRVRSS